MMSYDYTATTLPHLDAMFGDMPQWGLDAATSCYAGVIGTAGVGGGLHNLVNVGDISRTYGISIDQFYAGAGTLRAVASDEAPEIEIARAKQEAALKTPSILSSGSVTFDRMSIFYGLLEMTTRPVGWDGYDGVPASAEAVVAAFTFFERLSFDHDDPELELAGDGEVTLVWRRPGLYLEVGFYDDVSYSYFGRIDGAGGYTIANDGRVRENLLPAELSHFLAQFGHGNLRLRAA